MARKTKQELIAPLILLFALVWISASCSRDRSPETTSETPETAETHSQDSSEAHANHDPKHGGVFFMALDNEHHIEGILTEPGVFRIYLYDARLQPLHRDRVKQTKGTCYWGDLPEPPGIPLASSKDGQTLEATLDRKLNFPVTLTVLLHFAASNSAEAKPELFTFTFDRFSPTSSSLTQPADPSKHKTSH